MLTCGDTEEISNIKKEVSIWNINSFAELYMQIQEKYKKDYLAALNKFRSERKRFLEELKKISYLRVIPSQSNFFMIEIVADFDAHTLTNILLDKYSILIKDLSNKVGDKYIRIAIRNEQDDELIRTLKEIESGYGN